MEGDFSLSDLLVPAAAGAVGTVAAAATYAALSPRSRSGSDLGSAGDTAAALALGIPLTALTAYGVYKFADNLPASENPWLYKMNPSYWFKTSAEKRYIEIEKKRGSRNVNLDRELSAAERAYRTSTSAASKEAQITPIQAGLKSQGVEVGAPFVGPLRSDNLPFVHFPGTWDALSPKRDATDKAIMGRIRRIGRGVVPRKGDHFDFRQAKALFEIVDGYFRERPDYHLMDTERWMARYVESMGITYTDHDGKVYVMKGKVRVPAQSASLGAAPSRDPATQISRSLAAAGLPIAPGTTYTYEQNLRAAEAVRGLMAKDPGAEKLFRGWVEGQGITWVDENGAVKGYRSGRVFVAAPPAPLDVVLKTSKGLKTANVMGGDGLFVGAVTLSGGPSKFLKVVAGMQAPKIIAAARAAGLAGKTVWTAEERDKVALGLLKSMKGELGGKNPGTGDARIARETVAAWAVSHGVKVPSGDTTSGGAEVGIEWWKLNPIYGAAWLGKQAVTSTIKAVKSVFGKKKQPSAYDRRMLALKAAASAQAASKARILAAEKKHEAAVAEREEEKNVAEAEAKAADAEAAAREAEAIAITAEAEKGLRGTAEAVEGIGWTVTGWSVTGRGANRWSVIGKMHPKLVGKFARVGASNTAKGQRLRFAAHVADSAGADRRTCADVKAVTKQARMGHALARKQLSLINMGAVASAQATQALANNAGQKREIANGWKKRLVTYGTAEKAIRLPRLLSFGTALGWWKNPVQFGTPRWIKKLAGHNARRPAMTGAELMGLAPKAETKLAPVPGEPADVLVTVTAAAKTMGIPAPVAMSMVAAAKSGVPDAKRQLAEATKIYQAAQQGDKEAKAQIAAVQADSKTMYGPALQKAAALAAAVGLAKGHQQYAARKDARARAAGLAAKHIPIATAEATRARKAGYELGMTSTAPTTIHPKGFFEKLFNFQRSHQV
jgi:hypothetical protein